MLFNYQNLIDKEASECGIIGRYFKASVLVPFVELNNKWYILFEKRAKGVKQEGEICFPGGGIEENDSSPKEAAIRECIEELGMTSKQIIIDKQNDLLVNVMGIQIYNFTGRLLIDTLDDLNINKAEVEKILLVPVDFFLNNQPKEYELCLEVKSKITDSNGDEKILFPAKELGVPQKYENSWIGNYDKVYVYKYDGEIIWGMTAKIVQNLFSKN